MLRLLGIAASFSIIAIGAQAQVQVQCGYEKSTGRMSIYAQNAGTVAMVCQVHCPFQPYHLPEYIGITVPGGLPKTEVWFRVNNPNSSTHMTDRPVIYECILAN